MIGVNEVKAQQVNTDSLLNMYLKQDSLTLNELLRDSISLLDLIDSLLNTDIRLSLLSIRTSYTSNVVNAGRDFGFEQYGLSGGVSYYHKSGLFGDITGYWNSDSDPKYNLTVLGAGYMNNLSPAWDYTMTYDYYLFHEGDSIKLPLNQSIGLTTYFDLKFISPGVDYTFYFGDEIAHRIRPAVYSTIRIKNIWFLDDISFYPGVSMLFGNQKIITLNENYQAIQSILRRIGHGKFLGLYKNRPELINSLVTEESIQTTFGLMNYSLSLPVSFRSGRFSISTGYYINFPVALPDENIDTSPNGYFNMMILYSVPFFGN